MSLSVLRRTAGRSHACGGVFLTLAAPVVDAGEQDAGRGLALSPGPRLGLFPDCAGHAQALRHLRTKSPCVDTFVLCL